MTADQILLSKAESYLLSFSGITREILDAHLAPDPKPESLEGLFRRYCFSVSNKQRTPNVIKGTIGSLEALSSVFCGFSPSELVKKYRPEESSKLFSDLQKNDVFKKHAVINEAKRGTYPQLCESVLSGAYFFSQFKDRDDFYNWADFFNQDERARLALPLILSAEIHGLGFALACDFLKEIGYEGFGKPDVHIKEIFRGIGMMNADKKAGNDDLIAFKIILRIAKNTGWTPYAVDKILWLVGSGNFYSVGKVVKTNRDEFIRQVNQEA